MKNSLLLLLFISCLSCTNNKKSASASSTADTITSASVDVETTDTSDEIYEKPLIFSELVAKVPITPLPFGISGIDTLNIYQPLSDHSLPPYGYDTLNVYKLNTEDLRYLNDLNSIFSEEEALSERNSYFSKRFPPLSTGEEVLLYFQRRREEGSAFWLIVCNQDGKLISELRLFESGNDHVLGYINKNYEAVINYYRLPREIGKIHEFGFTHLGDKVPDFVKKIIT
ncbi:hypothetical protein [Bacteroides sp. 224]|uniref:hypothetical protein n=1 Tax=Bacteroides sp. 224 TaxID=2302936 RepID=UPI0013D712F8|nr:hypothetical protein [Bacteroides sp. 224]NDV65325.1 hypothetical protein [Bacteroides sp. 224]